MDKTLLNRFIDKYNLNGSAESVIWSATNNSIKTDFFTDDRNVYGSIKLNNFELEDGEYCIFDTSQLRSLLSVLDSDIKLKVLKRENRNIGFSFSGNSAKVVYTLATEEVMPKLPKKINIPEWDIIININIQFLTTFMKSVSAMSDITEFSVLSDGRNTQIVLGYSKNRNSNRITMDVDSTSVPSDPISFSSLDFRNILAANKEMKSGTIKISKLGLANISFEIDEFDAQYYLIKTNINL